MTVTTRATPELPFSAEERYRLVVESVRDYAIFMLDAQGRVTTWNRGAEAIKGWRAQEIIGRHFSTFYPAPEVAAGKPDFELVEAEKTGRFEDEGWRVRKDGSRFWANVVITALRDADGRLVGFAKVTRDLTERRRAEEARIHLARSEEAIRVRDQFLVMLSHELRNPLAPIRNAIEIMDRTPPGSDASRHARDVIARQFAHLSHIVESVLDLGRLTRGTIELRRERLDLAALARRTAEDHQGMLRERGVTLVPPEDAEPIWIDGDPTRLVQLLANLLYNAAKFTPSGGHVWVTLARGERVAELHVRDDGIGMTRELLGHVFQPFVQGDRTLARSEGGLGLGLALVKGFAELHGGSVTATSPGPDQGAEFVVTLPLAEPTEAPSPAAPAREAAATPRRVLVVDDNVDAADSMAELLRILGHDAAVALDGHTAVQRALAERFDVVLCDIGLPGMTGYDVARVLRATPGAGDLTLVALSGYATPAHVQEALAAGFDRHLAKPPDLDELERILADA